MVNIVSVRCIVGKLQYLGLESSSHHMRAPAHTASVAICLNDPPREPSLASSMGWWNLIRDSTPFAKAERLGHVDRETVCEFSEDPPRQLKS